jgi:hypothetical protein
MASCPKTPGTGDVLRPLTVCKSLEQSVQASVSMIAFSDLISDAISRISNGWPCPRNMAVFMIFLFVNIASD